MFKAVCHQDKAHTYDTKWYKKWGRGSEKVLSTYYKMFQEGASKLTLAISVIKNLLHDGQTNLQCVRKSLIEYEVIKK